MYTILIIKINNVITEMFSTKIKSTYRITNGY